MRPLLLALTMLVAACSPKADEETVTPKDAGADTGPPVCLAPNVVGPPICSPTGSEGTPCEKEPVNQFYYTCNAGKCPAAGCREIVQMIEKPTYTYWCCDKPKL